MNLSALINELSPTVYRFLLARTCNEDIAQELTQQVFLTLFEKKPRFECKAALKVWLIKCAKNTFANYIKRHENSKTVPLDLANDIATTDESLFEFKELLSALPQNLYDVTVLYYIEDMKTEDIARALSISRGNVKTRLLRARQILKKIYEEEIL